MIASYQNGDYTVTLMEDGTKIREWDCEDPNVEFPESVDLKITNYCDLNCAFCHEKSTVDGKDARDGDIHNLIEGLPPGVELALGGGNPLEYKGIEYLLEHIASKGIIANMTVNAGHLTPSNIELINKYRNQKLIHGLGVSLDKYYNFAVDEVRDENTVLHLVCGVHKTSALRQCLSSGWGNKNKLKVLILGYKQYGRGTDYFGNNVKKVTDNILKWKMFIASFINSDEIIVSFDNLALTQLGIKDMIPERTWEEKYMGDDGCFTMFVDAVKMQYARSSVNTHLPVDGRTIKELFKEL